MSSQLKGVAARFEELRTRLEAVAGDDTVLADMLTELTEAAIRQAELIDAILDELPVGITVIDPSLRVTHFNQRAREIIGCLVTSTTPMADWPVELYHLDGTPMGFDERPSVRALLGEESEDVVFEVGEQGRDPYVLKGSATPIRDDAGEPIFAVSVFEDVTETQRREQADRDFVANAAHQIRTPIAAMMSASQALQAGAKNEPEMRDRFLGHIDRELARMRMLADGLLAHYAAPNAATFFHPLPDQAEARARARDRAQRKQGRRRARAGLPGGCDRLHERGARQRGARERSHQRRAAHHARNGHRAGGAAAGERHGRSLRRGRDRGLARTRVFERFLRGHHPAEAGVGLGLAIAAAATNAAGGVLELVDAPVGTCFRFTFRRATVGR